MLTKMDERQKAAFRRLRSPEMEPVLQYLTQENGVILGALMTLTDENTLRQFQGRAQLINELLALVEKLD